MLFVSRPPWREDVPPTSLPMSSYKGLIRPCMEYASHAREGSAHTALLNRVEPKAFRLINYSSPLTDCLQSLRLRREVASVCCYVVLLFRSPVVLFCCYVVLLFLFLLVCRTTERENSRAAAQKNRRTAAQQH